MTAPDPGRLLERIFPGDGEMAGRMRAYPWRDSPLGDPAGWPQSLRTAVQICLTSRFPIVLWWGRELRLLYNDAWRPVLGRTKHPAALGARGREVWPEIWHIIGPMFQSVLDRGEATWSHDQLLPLDRNGYLEEAYFTYSYSPIPDEQGRVGGVFAAVSETTLKVVAERRLRTLRELAAQTLQAKGAVEAARTAMQTLAANRADVPFALLYLVGEDGRARLEQFGPAEVAATDGRWPIGEALERGEPIVLDRLVERVGALPSPWPTPPQHALVLPLKSAAQGRALAVLVLGVNPARELDEEHRGFLDMAARHIAASVANASAYEEERRRAEALAELDRAKTAFFSNVSHEFRTPLTLMLGPAEDILAKPAQEVTPASRAALEVVHRNGQRLLRLVNTLLDFARIEAGRAQASYEPTDLAGLTADLASNFRSACERAGLRLVVDCPGAGEAYVDREMWEKIVLNLVSNAFKFTLAGEIAVRVRRAGGAFELEVSDTGSGIPEAALPRMFERFHRVEGAQGRSHEGSGIGLALVHELVRLHGGTIGVESTLGKGSTFKVSIPAGSAHLPADRVRAPREAVSTGLRAGAFVDEALSWLPGAPGPAPAARSGGPRVLVADDNADLREYARKLLAEHYEVEAVADGEAALAAARARKPDLVVTDIMMPGLDGFGLIRALRADEALRDTPVIALSARAGEEARIEGLGRGADDYLTKPFGARELLVRCEALLRAQGIRRGAEERVRAIVEATPECVKLVARDGTLLQMNAAGLAMVGATCADAVVGRSIYDVIAPEDRARFREFNERVCAGERGMLEFDVVGLDGNRRHMETHAVPLARPQGGFDQLAITRDVTERRLAEERLRRSEQALNDFFETASVGLHWVGPDGTILRANPAELEMLGYAKEEYVGRHIADFHVERAVIDDILARLGRGERLHERPAQMRCKDGSVRDVLITSSVLFENGKFVHTRCFTVDVTARRRAEKALLARAEQQKAVAVLGELALRERDMQKVFDQATGAVARTLGAEYCKVLELLPGGTEVLLRAGVGWKPGLVGSARIGAGMDSQAGYTLASKAPVVVQDLRTETRFRGPPLLTEHGVVSGMSCIITGPEGGAWGVLGTHSTRRIEFTKDDVAFLTSVANILGHAIQRERAESALRESDRRKDEFIAMLSHELRNPLAPLKSALELMRLKAPPGSDGELRAMMERQLGHLVRLVDDLLESSRITRGLLELKREPLELAAVLRGALESAEPLIRDAGHRLEIDLPGEPLWIDGDPVRLVQSFANLLNNAARYTPRGGRIRLHAARWGDARARVSVRDSGAGFSQATEKRLFEMFSRGEGSSGLGIGLALARRLVDMHGGTIEARSEGEGRGAEFIVTLPLADAPASASRAAAASGGDGLRVLVADDNRDAAESLAALLRALGNEVSVAYDGIEAVNAARAFRPHVVLLDIGMPGLDGYGAAREIRKDPGARRIKIVAVTGWGQEQDRRRAREAGFDAHIVKPAELEVLRRVLAEP